MKAPDAPLDMSLTTREAEADLKKRAKSPSKAGVVEQASSTEAQPAPLAEDRVPDSSEDSPGDAPAPAAQKGSAAPAQDIPGEEDAPEAEAAETALTAKATVDPSEEKIHSEEGTADAVQDGAIDGKAEQNADGEADSSVPVELAGEESVGEESVGAESDEPEPDSGPDVEVAQAGRGHNTVKIRGRPGGVAIEIGQGDWSEMLAILRTRLEIAEGFFRGGRVVLDVGDQTLDEDALELAFDILSEFEMQIAVVRGTVESTLDAAARMGITSTTVATEDPARGVAESHVDEELHHEVSSAFYVHHGNLRSGQVLERTESVIVIGDVNPGAQVVSHGDVLVYGRLRGSVHAGADGDAQAMVTAIDFEPTQLRIAGFTSVPPEDKKPAGGVGLLFWRKDADAQPGAEYAYAADGRIFVEPWNPARSGSLAARRRRV